MILDEGLTNISKLFLKVFGKDVQNIKGAGAAGGMGAGSLVFLNAKLQSGIKLVKELVDFEEKIKNANWIITGEGKLDSQTLSGKTILGVLESAKKHQISVAALCGSLSLSIEETIKMGITYRDSVIENALNMEDAMEQTEKYLSIMTRKFGKSL